MPSPSWGVADVAAIIGHKVDDLKALAAGANGLYSPYTKKKPNGGRRVIARPDTRLKRVQRAILTRLFPKLFPKPSAVVQTDAVLNARAHRAGHMIATLDLKDAFPSVRAEKVLQVLRAAGLQPTAAKLVARLCTFLGALPQGAPTSPALLDAVLGSFDREVFAFASRRGVLFTRYVDDMTVSGDGDLEPVIERIVARSTAHAFDVHPEKMARGGGEVPVDITGVRIVDGQTKATPKALAAAEEAVGAFARDACDKNQSLVDGRIAWINRVDPHAARRMRATYVRGPVTGSG